MPIATAQQYTGMLYCAAAGGCALAGANVGLCADGGFSEALNAAPRLRPSGREGEAAMATLVAWACEQLGSAGRSVRP